VSGKAIDGHNTCVFELRVAKEDIDKIIGREGRTAHSIGTIINAAAAKMKKRVVWKFPNNVALNFMMKSQDPTRPAIVSPPFCGSGGHIIFFPR